MTTRACAKDSHPALQDIDELNIVNSIFHGLLFFLVSPCTYELTFMIARNPKNYLRENCTRAVCLLDLNKIKNIHSKVP